MCYRSKRLAAEPNVAVRVLQCFFFQRCKHTAQALWRLVKCHLPWYMCARSELDGQSDEAVAKNTWKTFLGSDPPLLDGGAFGELLVGK